MTAAARARRHDRKLRKRADPLLTAADDGDRIERLLFAAAYKGVTDIVTKRVVAPREREKCRIRVGDEIRASEAGKVIALGDACDHELWNDTDDERAILLFDFDRPMRLDGRIANRPFLRSMKLGAFYREPRAALADFEARFEAATRRADQTLGQLGDR